MTIEHMPDGTKQVTSPEGVVTKHADMSAALHYRATGQRAAHDVPEGSAPAGGSTAPAQTGEKDAIELYKERCRNVGVARARKTAGLA